VIPRSCGRGGSATLGTGSTFAGNILALTSITVTTGVTLNGRAPARNGAVTLDTDLINWPADCAVGPTPSPTPTATADRTENSEDQQAFSHQDNGTDLNLTKNDDHHSTSVTGSSDRRANVPVGRPQAFTR
jgi:hypothetical protein